MHPAGFETKIPANRRPQPHALVCVATGIATPLFPESFSFSLEGDHSVIYWYSCSDLISMKYVEDQRVMSLSTAIIWYSNDISVTHGDEVQNIGYLVLVESAGYSKS
jgi:hypothetical protein